MVSVSQAGFCGHPGCSELRQGQARVSDRPALADGLQLVHKRGEVSFHAAAPVERLCCQRLLVVDRFGLGSSLCHNVELFS